MGGKGGVGFKPIFTDNYLWNIEPGTSRLDMVGAPRGHHILGSISLKMAGLPFLEEVIQIRVTASIAMHTELSEVTIGMSNRQNAQSHLTPTVRNMGQHGMKRYESTIHTIPIDKRCFQVYEILLARYHVQYCTETQQQRQEAD